MNRDNSLIFLSSLFAASLVTANLIGSKIFLVFGISISAGILVLPVTFLITDIVSEVYGSKIANKIVLFGILIQIYVLLVVQVGGVFPADPRRDLTEAYDQMFSLTPRMVLASITAYSFSQFFDVWVFHKLKELTNKKYLWLRNNASTMLSQAIDSAIFLGIFLGGVLPFPALWKTYLSLYGLKVLCAVIDTPFVYLGVKYFKK